MPVLDSFLDHPMFAGPTIDADAEQAAPLYREEPFQLQPTGTVDLQLRQEQSRPVTHRMDHSLHAGDARIMVRDSNLNPENAGNGSSRNIWKMNDPWQPQTRSHLGVDIPSQVPLITVATLVGLAGVLFWYLNR